VRLLRYAFEEARTSLWRGRRSGLLSTATIAIALFVLGAFLIVTSNLERLAEEWSGAAELSVYLNDAASADERAAIERMLSGDEAVATVAFVSKAEAVSRFKAMFADLAATISTLEENPLPASFDVRLRPTAAAQRGVEALALRLRDLPGVADVRFDRQWLDRLMNGVRVLRLVGLTLGGALMLAAALTVGNVVRLALAARQDELEIMHLVGAPQSYVRGPFVMEGALHGGVGAALAIVALGIAFLALRQGVLVPLARALNLSGVAFLSPALTVALIGGGLAVGCLAGLVASRRA
jgi:cell division transport system permease protein